jgi:DNA polymerase III delta subunit
VVAVASEIERSRRITKLLVEKSHVLMLAGLDGANLAEKSDARRAAERQVKEDFERLGRTIDARALKMLVDRAGGDISKLRDDAERLALYTEGQTTISVADVTEVSAIATDVDDEWAVVNAIEAGDARRALVETGRRLDRGDSVHAFVGQIRWWVSAKLSQSAPARVKPALDAVLRTDLALKGSGGDERVLVERLVVELAGR